MARIVALVVSVLSLLGASLAAPHPFGAHDMVDLDRVGVPMVNPSGNKAVFTRWTYDSDLNQSAQSLWVTDLTATNVTVAVTTSPYGSSDFNPVWLDDATIIFLSASRAPNGITQLFTVKVGSDNPVQLSDYPVAVETFKLFNSQGRKKIGFTARVYASSSLQETREIDDQKAKDPSSAMVFDRLYFRHWDTFSDHKYSHIFVAELTEDEFGSHSLEAEPIDLLFGQELESPVLPFGGTADYDFSPDGTELAFTALKPGLDQAWSTDTNIYLTNTSGQATPNPITTFNLAYDTYPVYSPDGTKIAYLAMSVPKYEADRRRVMIYNRATGTHTALTEAWDRSPDSIVWASNSLIYVTVGDVARENVYSVSVSSHTVSLVLKGAFIGGLAVTPRGLVFERSTQMSPNEIFTYDSGVLTQRTFVNKEKLDNILMSTPEEFWFTGALGDSVHGWIVKPVNFQSGVKYPVAFLVHGGPQSAWMDSFSTRWNPQAFAGAGFVTVSIDFHGSTTYGQAFTDAINGEWGSHPYDDLMLGLDYLIATYSYIDGDRVAALGGSYGGWMMNWLNGNTDRFRCLVNHCGLSDTTAMYFTTEELFFPEYDMGGTPWESDLYEKWNPMNLVTNWKTPTLILHGAKDYRVVDGQGFITFTALQRQGIKSRLVYFPDENHWILKPGNTLRWHSEVLGWIQECTA